MTGLCSRYVFLVSQCILWLESCIWGWQKI